MVMTMAGSFGEGKDDREYLDLGLRQLQQHADGESIHGPERLREVGGKVLMREMDVSGWNVAALNAGPVALVRKLPRFNG